MPEQPSFPAVRGAFETLLFGVTPFLCGLAALMPTGIARGATISLTPSLDTSIYNESNNSNATGPLFAGVTAQSSIRRALVEFDIASSGIPAGSVILSVSVSFTLLKTNSSMATLFELNPLTEGWGEGTSSGTGQGAAATSGDATWNFRLFNTTSWATAGASFGATSGTASIGTTTNATYTFASTPSLVSDVQGWLDTPSSNHGWLLRANAETGQSAREFGSRDSSLAQRPSLTVSYVVPELGSASLFAASVIFLSLSRTRRGKTAMP